MATGTPVVANNRDVLRELVPDEGGAFVEAANAEAFGETIVDSLERGDGSSSVKDVNQRAAEAYSWSAVGDRAANLYSELAPTNLTHPPASAELEGD
jgi:glycosyltransferase involved in cell wall biosynthesis